MTLPTEPIGSIPRPAALIEGMQAAAAGKIAAEKLEALFDDAVRDTIRRFEETGSPVITDGEQRKPSFATYPIHGLANLAPGGVTIPFKDGHTRQLPRPDRRPLPIRDPRRGLPGRREEARACPLEAGRHLRLGA